MTLVCINNSHFVLSKSIRGPGNVFFNDFKQELLDWESMVDHSKWWKLMIGRKTSKSFYWESMVSSIFLLSNPLDILKLHSVQNCPMLKKHRSYHVYWLHHTSGGALRMARSVWMNLFLQSDGRYRYLQLLLQCQVLSILQSLFWTGRHPKELD